MPLSSLVVYVLSKYDITISLSAIHACALGYLNPVGFIVRMLESNSSLYLRLDQSRNRAYSPS